MKRTLPVVGFIGSLLVLPQAIAVNFDPSDLDQVCHPYRCSSGAVSVQKRRFQFVSTGCNNSGGGMFMANQNPTDPQTEKCCHVRNACYQICGATKEFCDAQFDKCSMAVCDAMTSETAKKEQCVKDTELQKTLTKFSGCQVYDQAQGTSCECVMKSKVADSRKQVLQRFYKKFVPDSLHKVDTLAEKADNSKKFAGLLLKLVKKYPDCIKSVQDPKQKLMDDIINGRVNVEDLEHEVLPNKEAVDLDEL